MDKNIEEEYNRIFGADTWDENADMYIVGAYFLEPHFNRQMGGFTRAEEKEWQPQYDAVCNGEVDAFTWMQKNAKISSDVIFAVGKKNDYLHTASTHLSVVSVHETRKEYFIMDFNQMDGIELDILCKTKADAIRIFNGEW